MESMSSNEKPWQYQFLVDFEGHKDDVTKITLLIGVVF